MRGSVIRCSTAYIYIYIYILSISLRFEHSVQYTFITVYITKCRLVGIRLHPLDHNYFAQARFVARAYVGSVYVVCVEVLYVSFSGLLSGSTMDFKQWQYNIGYLNTPWPQGSSNYHPPPRTLWPIPAAAGSEMSQSVFAQVKASLSYSTTRVIGYYVYLQTHISIFLIKAHHCTSCPLRETQLT